MHGPDDEEPHPDEPQVPGEHDEEYPFDDTKDYSPDAFGD